MKKSTTLGWGFLSFACVVFFQNCSQPKIETSSSTPSTSSPSSSSGGDSEPVDSGKEPSTEPVNGDKMTTTIQTSFGPMTLSCQAFSTDRSIIPDGIFIRCTGDATSALKNAFDTSYSVPSTISVWGRNLVLNFTDFLTGNDSQQAYSDASCTQIMNYPMGSSRSFKSSASGAVPRCKLNDAGNTGQCVDSTECRHANTLSGVYYKMNQLGWQSVFFTYENVQR